MSEWKIQEQPLCPVEHSQKRFRSTVYILNGERRMARVYLGAIGDGSGSAHKKNFLDGGDVKERLEHVAL